MSDPVAQNMSTFNPADLGAMKQAKESGTGKFAGLTPDTPIREFFGQLGIDVDGPVSQLAQFGQEEMAKGDPLGKMERIAGAPTPGGGGAAPPPMPPTGGGGAAAPPPPGGLDGLMS